MGLFEQQPLLLIPLILAVVVSYDVAKFAIREFLSRRGSMSMRRRAG
jgi:hypothetical protein